MNDLKRDMMRIQELIGNAFRQTGSLVALTDGGQMNPNKLQNTCVCLTVLRHHTLSE